MPNPEPQPCPACQGGGKLLYPADLERATQGRRNYWELTITRGGQTFTTVIGG